MDQCSGNPGARDFALAASPALIHMHMLDADSLRIAVPQTP